MLFLLFFIMRQCSFENKQRTVLVFFIDYICHLRQQSISFVYWQDEHYILEMVFWCKLFLSKDQVLGMNKS